MRIPLASPEVDEETIAHLSAVLRRPTLSIGPRLESFEADFARFIGTSHAVGVNSGTSGLHLAVRIAGLGAGDEVITTPFSFVASANCLLFEGATPVFVDIDPDTFCMNLDAIDSAVTSRTRGLLPVHVFGNAVDMEDLMARARSRDWVVIEDACEAIGGEVDGKRLGSQGDFGIFGFYPNKQMTTGEGGMVVTHHDQYAARLKSLRNQGRSPTGDGRFVELGYNYRMSELTAALGEMQLKRLPGFVEERRQVEAEYRERLSRIDEIRVPPARDDRSPFVFVVQARDAGLRDHLGRHLTEHGIQNAVYFRPIHLEPLYRERFGFREGMFPEAERAGETCLALPFFTRLTAARIEEVATAVENGVSSWLMKRQVQTA